MCGMARPRKPLLSRERIVTTALALVDAEGLPALSTRRLAAELGVSGPSLYNHFATKEAILDAVADTVIAQVDVSMFEGGGSDGGDGTRNMAGADADAAGDGDGGAGDGSDSRATGSPSGGFDW